MKKTISVSRPKPMTLRIVRRTGRVITVESSRGWYEIYIPRDCQNGVRPNAFALAADEVLEIAKFLIQDLASKPYWNAGRQAIEFLRHYSGKR